MRSLPKAALLIASVQLVAVTMPGVAWAQNVEPVPYQTAPTPVPYGVPPSPAPPTPPASNPVGNDVIYLRDGGSLRGTIIDAIPNQPARIQLATGEIATVEWSAIDRIQRASVPQAPPPREAPRPAYVGEPTVFVHIDSPSPVEIQVHRGRNWETVCGSPCDQPLPASGRYRITGDGTKASREFSLSASRNGRADLTVHPASQGWFVIGIVGTAVGGATALIGALVGLTASIASDASAQADNGDASTRAGNVAASAWTAAAIGAGIFVVGLVALLQNRHSGLQWNAAAESAAKTFGTPWQVTTALREGTPEQRLMPTAQTSPFLTLHF